MTPSSNYSIKRKREKLRFGMVGAGAIAQSYLQAFEHCDEATLVAVADCRLDAAQRTAERMRCRSYDRVERMVQDCELDAAIVCTPPVTHPDICIHLLESKINVLCEKPFSIDELFARVRTALRRLDLVRSFASGNDASNTLLQVGDFTINTLSRQVTIRGEEVRLTPREYDLLLFFLRNADRVLTHSAVIKSIWGPHSTHQAEYLRVLVAALRKKIEPDPMHPRYLITDPWVGYRLTPAEENGE